jgi:hypothetical protein
VPGGLFLALSRFLFERLIGRDGNICNCRTAPGVLQFRVFAQSSKENYFVHAHRLSPSLFITFLSLRSSNFAALIAAATSFERAAELARAGIDVPEDVAKFLD